MSSELARVLDAAWENRTEINFATTGEVREAVEEVLAALDAGRLRVAEKGADGWVVNQWVKKAILLSFRLTDNGEISSGPGGSVWWDKVPTKFQGWGEAEFRAAGIRSVPGAFVRRGAYFGKGVIVMPSFVNIGAYVDDGTMVDSFATIGSACQIGKNCHISANVVIGGVLEPLQAGPVIIEDHCFVGACAAVTEGVRVETGAVIASGVTIGASTTIIDRATGETFFGRVPAYSVVVSGTLPAAPGKPATYAAVIMKRVDEGTRAKTSINELLRG
ncbi:2,3,4,5-tetrahydropyridine-2-carboxylate N-succinyltransferase [Rhizomicrobium palustre]|uniref:2,3,4,5-tetrahydropyridine-2-carboxylate N-succinyltransferase n=1 Tax=Rhizomicrobium palustre TaxID=189966 RepID=A0A846MWC7_9PROT|nr:2,3,4,5-tetrahydropyridine-2,6-dicarboxylate N-succinyltransferase [Rhizomicrobium palustre]NIK87858.1 2,3,4,5-tetrahydropyridine-2-carboxylate N-succinyltransferase [Rhizomicrobium palustre]